MNFKNYFLLLVLAIISLTVSAQEKYAPTSTGMLEGPIYVPSFAQQIADGTFTPSEGDSRKIGQPRMGFTDKVIPGKGLPKEGDVDVLRELQENTTLIRNRAPIQTFETTGSTATPSDPTGVVGPNHYVAAWNTSFRIFDKSGNPLIPATSLGSLFPGNNLGDPIVFYDAEADRFVITEFDNSPNGFNVAVCQGPDPVNDGWHVYTSGFGTGSFPDYTKFSVFGDVYMVTANIQSSNKVFAIERNEMLNGDPAQMISFPLNGLASPIGGFFSPQAFHTTDSNLAPNGTAVPIVYQQDDSYGGVSTDHIKIWSATVDWVTPGNSSISAPQQINTQQPFLSVFDGGSFDNLEQPSGPDIDAVQATIMNQAQYRRFGTHNSAVFNFVVDTDPGSGELAGIRWFELRQTADGQPWTIYQEGTYTSPNDNKHAWMASMVMNSSGDIAMGYTGMSSSISVGLYYTGRFSTDPLNVMTVEEDLIGLSTANSNNTRYADYSQLSLDPVDESFWFVGEYFSPARSNLVGQFQLEAPQADDIGVNGIPNPISGPLTASEDIEITIRNFGINDITNPEVQYTINGGDAVVENYAGTITAGTTVPFTFAAQADLSGGGNHIIVARTNLSGDSNPSNDETTKTVFNGTLYCEPAEDCSFGDGFTNVTIEEIDNDSGCEGYADFTNLAATLEPGSTYDLTVTTGYGDQNVRVWIDFNDDGTFDNSETVVSNFVIAAGQAAGTYTETVDLSIPGDVTPGNQHRMRLKSNWQAPVPDDACEETQYGETEDYSANMGVLGLENQNILSADLMVLTLANNQFDISLTTEFDGIASIAISNILGQTLAFNNLAKEGNSYNYKLDMSYADAGVYFIKMGDNNSKTYKTAKIIVK